jgi:hypothetical protein
MRKLKVGDEVKCHGDFTFDPAIGNIVKIYRNTCSVRIKSGRDTCWRANNGVWNYRIEELQLLKSVKEKVKQFGIVKWMKKYYK